MMMVRGEAQRNGLMNNASLSAGRPSLSPLWKSTAGEAPEMIISLLVGVMACVISVWPFPALSQG